MTLPFDGRRTGLGPPVRLAGVYYLMEPWGEGRVRYVGQSNDLYRRARAYLAPDGPRSQVTPVVALWIGWLARSNLAPVFIPVECRQFDVTRAAAIREWLPSIEKEHILALSPHQPLLNVVHGRRELRGLGWVRRFVGERERWQDAEFGPPNSHGNQIVPTAFRRYVTTPR